VAATGVAAGVFGLAAEMFGLVSEFHVVPSGAWIFVPSRRMVTMLDTSVLPGSHSSIC
jgi:hypothetical protein